MAEDPKKKKKRHLLGLLLFMPLVSLRKEISQASDDIEKSFDDMYDEFEHSASPHKATKKGRSGLTVAMQGLIGAALLKGYSEGVKRTGHKDAKFERSIKQLGSAQGTKAAGQMLGTTKDWLKANGSDGYTLSRDRAERAVRYKASEAYFNGLGRAFPPHEWEKAWNTTSDAPCEDCLENEDEEWIPMEATFQSGHYGPLAHLNCLCFMSTRRVGTGD